MDVKRIWDTAQVGDIVVLDHISLNANDPLAPYMGAPAFFTVVKVQRDREVTPRERTVTTYTLRDTKGVETTTERGSFGCGGGYLIRVDDWREWKAAREKEKREKMEAELKRLLHREEVLREVLTAQGVRVLTESQATALGIKRPG